MKPADSIRGRDSVKNPPRLYKAGSSSHYGQTDFGGRDERPLHSRLLIVVVVLFFLRYFISSVLHFILKFWLENRVINQRGKLNYSGLGWEILASYPSQKSSWLGSDIIFGGRRCDIYPV